MKGTCYFRINPMTATFGAMQKSPFSLDFMTSYLSEKNKVKAQKAAQNNDPTDDREMYDYALNDLIVRPDEGCANTVPVKLEGRDILLAVKP